MELPKIIESILPTQKPLEERVLALVITVDHIKCALLDTQKEGAILGSGEEEYMMGDWSSVIKAADMAIAKATSGIENANQIKRTIFSLPYDWIENDKIKPEHLSNLKKLSEDLDLKPLGFVVTTEAIIHYLQKQEGSPLTTILVGFTSQKMFATLVHAGQKEATKEKPLTPNIAEDLKNILSEFPSIEIFPSRILLYDHTNDLDKIKQELLSYAWQKHPGFLHFPKIEVLDKDIDLKSAVLASVTELGIEIETKKPPEEKEVTAPRKEIKEEPAFVEGDIFEVRKETPKEQAPQKEEEIKITPPPEVLPEKAKEIAKPPIAQKIKLIPIILKNRVFTLLPSSFLTKRLFKISIFILPIILFVLGGLATAAYWYLPKAKVTLVVESRQLEKSLLLIISQDIKAVDEENKKIPALSVETEVSGQKATTATGKKTVGDKAKGEITIYNKTSNSKTFSKGTEIIGPKNLKFTLDEEVTIASASTGLEGVTFGKTKTKITAAQIGTESNLNSGSEFSFKDFPTSSYSARNEQNLGGGTSKEITVITKEDQTRLQDNLTSELLEKAKQSLKEKLTKSEVILEKGLKTTVASTKFDKEIDSEAKDTTLNLTLKVKALFYKDADIKSLVVKSLEKDIPDGYELKSENINISIDKVTFTKDEGTAQITAKASLLPKIDTQKIQKDIIGKYPEVLDGYFKSIPSVAGYEIKLIPELPKRFATTPHLPQNTTIEIIAR